MEVKLELQTPEMVFNPTLDQESPEGFYMLMEGLIEDVFRVSTLVPRVAKHSGQEDYGVCVVIALVSTYCICAYVCVLCTSLCMNLCALFCTIVWLQVDVEEIAELSDLRDELMGRVSNIISQSTEFQGSFDQYAYLWVDDRQVFMEQFLLYGHVLTTEEIEQAGDEGVPETPPTLSQFKGQVDTYEKMYAELEQVSSTAVFEKWFRVDVRPFRQALLNVVKRWSFMFKEHLINHVTNR